MVEANGAALQDPVRVVDMTEEQEENAATQLQWTVKLVQTIDKRLHANVTADELKKLSVENAKPEFKKVL